MLAKTCLADKLSTLSTFNWGKLQRLNVDFFVYIKLSTFYVNFALMPNFSGFRKFSVKIKSFSPILSTLSTILRKP